MKKIIVRPFIIWPLFIILFCCSTIGAWWIIPGLIQSPREKEQEKLAIKLGVNIKDYPYKTSFPVGYFATVLQQDMTIADVHKIIQGYWKVLHCGYTSEIYYYFSSELENAKRFEIIYDDQGNFLRLEGEEDDSRTIQTFGCETGLIKK